MRKVLNAIFCRRHHGNLGSQMDATIVPPGETTSKSSSRQQTRRTKALTTMTALAFASAAMIACSAESRSGAGSGGELDHIDIGMLPIVASAPVLLGIEKGFFEEEGLELTTHFTQSADTSVAAVVSGQYQISFASNAGLIVAADKALPVEIVYPANKAGTGTEPLGAEEVLVAGGNIDTLEDLEGMKVASNTLYNVTWLSIVVALEKAGVDYELVDFIKVPFPDMPTVLQQGRIDAAQMVEPFLTTAQQENPDLHVLPYTYREIQPDMYVSSWFTQSQFAEENPEIIEKFERAIRKAQEYCANNTDEVRESLPELFDIDPKVAEELNMIKWPSGPMSEEKAGLAESIRILSDYYQKYDVTNNSVNAADLIVSK